MKKLITGLMIFGSISTFASTEIYHCGWKARIKIVDGVFSVHGSGIEVNPNIDNHYFMPLYGLKEKSPGSIYALFVGTAPGFEVIFKKSSPSKILIYNLTNLKSEEVDCELYEVD